MNLISKALVNLVGGAPVMKHSGVGSDVNPCIPYTRLDAAGDIIDYSDTVLTAGVSQNAIVYNADRRLLLLQNTAVAAVLWFDFDAAAVAASPSIRLAPGEIIVFSSGFVPAGALFVTSDVSATPFTCRAG